MGEVVFTADDGVHGTELWVTDGTAAGTRQLADIRPGAGASNPIDLTVDGSLVYFAANDGTGVELWRTDGTAAGTFALSTPANGAGAQMITPVGHSIFYAGSDSSHGSGLFVSDGTVGGTHFLGAFANVSGLTALGNGLIFQATDAAHGSELWFSDGTSAGTHLVADIHPGPASSSPSSFTVLNGVAYFTANDGTYGTLLWKSDGTAAGTSEIVVKDAFGIPGGSPTLVGVAGGELYFQQTGHNGVDLWVTDGTAAGATQLTQGDYWLGSYYAQVVGDRVYYNDQIPGQNSAGLYVTNGMGAAPTLVAAVYVNSAVTAVGQHLVFEGEAPSSTLGLYVSDGTPGTTTRVASGSIGYGSQVTAGGRLYFDFSPDGGGQIQLWTSDGTAAGTHLLYAPDPAGSGVTNIRADGADILFNAWDAVHGAELWISDGTAAGTHMVADINAPASFPAAIDTQSGSAQAGSSGAVDLGGKLIFAADVNGVLGPYVDAGTGAGPARLSSAALPWDQGVSAIGDFTVAGAHAFYTLTSFGTFGTPAGTLWATAGAPGDSVNLTYKATYLTAFNGALYFEAAAGSLSGLYRSDGSVAGTTLVSAFQEETQPVVLNGKLLLGGWDSSHGSGLFVSDGTPGGLTFLNAVIAVTDLTVSGTKAFFVGDSGAGQELWVTDGTAAGTVMVKDIELGALGSDPAGLTAYDGGVIFTADDQIHGRQVWFSDGTAGGTRLLDINTTSNPAASLDVERPVLFNGAGYFVGNDQINGDQLFSTDGTTAGTTLVANLTANGFGPDVTFVTVLNGKLFFTEQDNAWVSDGTSAGTVELTGAWGLVSQPLSFDGEVYFRGYSPNNPAFSVGLYVTDGTSAGTHLVLDDGNPVATAGDNIFLFGSNAGQGGLFAHNALTATTTLLGDIGGNVVQTASLGSELYFTVRNNADVYNLWKSDGTAAGTQLVKAAPASSDGFLSLTALDGKLYLASDGPAAGLWVSDGTTAGTTEIAQVLARDLTTIGGKLFFMGYDTTHGNEIWSYDPATGVAAITVDADPGSTSSQPDDLTAGPDGSAYFIANDATGRAEVWRVAASGQVSELTSPINGAPFPNGLSTSLTVMGSKIFFGGTDSVHGDGLFVTDGTQVTFLASVSINSGASASVVGGLLYFEGADAVNGSELWVSDGTAAGTHRVTDTEAPSDANASDFTVAGGKVFFSATDGVHGQELWDFNGSGAAQMVRDINPGAGGSAPTDLTAFDGAAYFVASGGGGSQLWRSDGSAAGTVAITSASNGAGPRYLTVDGAKLFFYGSDSTHGAGLFVTDGTAGGTHFLLAYSLADGSAAGANPGFSVAGGELYFNGPKAGGGFEIWRSDGTLAGTTAVPDATVDNGSNPQHLTGLLPPLAGALDFDGHGRGDLLIQNAVGAVVVGEVGAGGQASFAQVSALGPEWKFVGEGDFMDHGRADYLIQNASGAVDLGEIGAGGQASYVQVAALGPEWSFKGTGDFLGHGDDQFLILNTDGAVYVGEVNSGQAQYAEVGALGPEWSFKGTGDFLGDGRTDFLIQNTGGAVVLGEVGVNGQAAYTQIAALGPEWSFEGVGDFLGDGKADFLIKSAGGAVVVGEVVGGHATYTQVAALGSEWTFKGAADYLGEGHDQFLIENASGTVVVGDYLNGQIHYTQIAALGSEWGFHP